MAPLADFLLKSLPLRLPAHYMSYIRGQTPLSTTPAVAVALTSYFVAILSGVVYMKNRKPHRLTALFRAHNMFLSVGSFLLLILSLEEAIPLWWNNGFFYAICSEKSWTPRLEFYYLINHYFKFLELLDTIFLVLKKKPLLFLHVYHHCMTASISYYAMILKPSIAWVIMSLNLAVHVIMYYYYYASAGGIRFWWKKYLTAFQIAQFIIDLVVICAAAYSHLAHVYFRDILPSGGNCAGFGYKNAAVMSTAILASYLALFTKFYFQTYKNLDESVMTIGKSRSQLLAFALMVYPLLWISDHVLY